MFFALRSVRRTQLDALAIAIGTSHGAYKFTRKPTGDILAIDRIKEILAHPEREALLDVFQEPLSGVIVTEDGKLEATSTKIILDIFNSNLPAAS